MTKRKTNTLGTPENTPTMRRYLHRLHMLHFVIIMVRMEHTEWLDQLIAPLSRRTAAHRIGVNDSTITRQLQRGSLSPEMVIALCRAFNRSPIEGLVETGYLYPHEMDMPSVKLALRNATNSQILDEINRRSDPEARELFTADNDSDVIDIADHNNVYDLHNAPRVADESPTEPEGNFDDYHP